MRSSRKMYSNRVAARIGEFPREPQTATFDASGRHGDGEDALAALVPGGARKSFWVAYPIQAAPAVKVNGVDKTAGIAGVDSFMDWSWPAGSTLEATYAGIVQNVVEAQNGGEIALRGSLEDNSGYYEVLKDASMPQNSAQSQQFAQAALDQNDEASAAARIAANSVIEPLASTARAGQRIRVDVDGYQAGGRVGGIVFGSPHVVPEACHGFASVYSG